MPKQDLPGVRTNALIPLANQAVKESGAKKKGGCRDLSHVGKDRGVILRKLFCSVFSPLGNFEFNVSWCC